jgi:acetyl-CoA/propionyl-CoA carboxylase biotin carboxyl carrier protein
VAGLLLMQELETHGELGDSWTRSGGWRLGERAPVMWCLIVDSADEPIEVAVSGSSREASIAVAAGPAKIASLVWENDGDLVACIDGQTSRWLTATADATMWLMRDGQVTEIQRAVMVTDSAVSVGSDEQVRSPMPGTVVAVSVSVGDVVEDHASLAVVEAMKMEHQIRAPHSGVVEKVLVDVGDQVAMGALLFVVKEG